MKLHMAQCCLVKHNSHKFASCTGHPRTTSCRSQLPSLDELLERIWASVDRNLHAITAGILSSRVQNDIGRCRAWEEARCAGIGACNDIIDIWVIVFDVPPAFAYVPDITVSANEAGVLHVRTHDMLDVLVDPKGL